MLTSGCFNSKNAIKDHFIRYRKDKRDVLTFILGSRCSDGIVMVGDRKISRSQGSPTYEDKIFADIENVVLGASGVTGLYDKFRREIYEAVRTNPKISVSEFISESESIVYRINREYVERTRGNTIDLLVAYGRNQFGDLQYVTPNGIGEVVRRYQVIGSGEPYAEYFLRKIWKPELTMKQVAVLGSFVIKYIEENELDEAVGVGTGKSPQIWFIPDWPSNTKYEELPREQQLSLDTRQISGEELNDIMNQANTLYQKIDKNFNGIIV